MQTRNRKTSPALDTPTRRAPRDCPVEDWLTFLGHRWNALLLWHLSVSPKRHGELVTLLPGISPKVLAERLSTLAQRGLIDKSPLATFPRTVSYALSEQGVQIVFPWVSAARSITGENVVQRNDIGGRRPWSAAIEPASEPNDTHGNLICFLTFSSDIMK